MEEKLVINNKIINFDINFDLINNYLNDYGEFFFAEEEFDFLIINNIQLKGYYLKIFNNIIKKGINENDSDILINIIVFIINHFGISKGGNVITEIILLLDENILYNFLEKINIILFDSSIFHEEKDNLLFFSILSRSIKNKKNYIDLYKNLDFISSFKELDLMNNFINGFIKYRSKFLILEKLLSEDINKNLMLLFYIIQYNKFFKIESSFFRHNFFSFKKILENIKENDILSQNKIMFNQIDIYFLNIEVKYFNSFSSDEENEIIEEKILDLETLFLIKNNKDKEYLLSKSKFYLLKSKVEKKLYVDNDFLSLNENKKWIEYCVNTYKELFIGYTKDLKKINYIINNYSRLGKLAIVVRNNGLYMYGLFQAPNTSGLVLEMNIDNEINYNFFNDNLRNIIDNFLNGRLIEKSGKFFAIKEKNKFFNLEYKNG